MSPPPCYLTSVDVFIDSVQLYAFILQQVLALESFYEESSDSPMPCCVDKLTACDKHKFSSMLHITEHRLYQIVRWARHLPNFLSVKVSVRI